MLLPDRLKPALSTAAPSFIAFFESATNGTCPYTDSRICTCYVGPPGLLSPPDRISNCACSLPKSAVVNIAFAPTKLGRNPELTRLCWLAMSRKRLMYIATLPPIQVEFVHSGRRGRARKGRTQASKELGAGGEEF